GRRPAQDNNGRPEPGLPGPRVVPDRGAGPSARRRPLPGVADAGVLLGRRRRLARRDARPPREGPRDGGPDGDADLGHPRDPATPGVRPFRHPSVQGPGTVEVPISEGDRRGPPDRDRRPEDVVLAIPATPRNSTGRLEGVRALLRPEPERHRGARGDLVRGEPEADRQGREPLLLRPRSRGRGDLRPAADRTCEGAAPPGLPGPWQPRNSRRSKGPRRRGGFRAVP